MKTFPRPFWSMRAGTKTRKNVPSAVLEHASGHENPRKRFRSYAGLRVGTRAWKKLGYFTRAVASFQAMFSL